MGLFKKVDDAKSIQELEDLQKQIKDENKEQRERLKTLKDSVDTKYDELQKSIKELKSRSSELTDKEIQELNEISNKISNIKKEEDWEKKITLVVEQELKFENEIDGALRMPFKFYEDVKPTMLVFYGATGSGKTTAAKLLEKTLYSHSEKKSKYNFYCWIEKVYSEFKSIMAEGKTGSEARAYKLMYDKYKSEKEKDPNAVITFIIDEADTIVPTRMPEGESNAFRNDKTNEFLKFYDQIKELGNGLIILTTNNINSFDSAARRRCDIEIEFNGEYSNDYKIKKYRHLLLKYNIKEEDVDWSVHMDLIEKQIKKIYMKRLEKSDVQR